MLFNSLEASISDDRASKSGYQAVVISHEVYIVELL